MVLKIEDSPGSLDGVLQNRQWDIPGYPRVSRGTPAYPRIARDTPGYPGIPRSGVPSLQVVVEGWGVPIYRNCLGSLIEIYRIS